MRVSIRLKLFLLSLFLFAIPWLGYQYVWELEKYLQQGQEQTIVGTARAVATALHERPRLFNNSASYLSDVKPGKDLYAHTIFDPIQLDGKLEDWLDYKGLALNYSGQHLLVAHTQYQPNSLSFDHMVGQYGTYLYAYFKVNDDHVVLRGSNSLRVDRNDFLQIGLIDHQGEFHRYIVATTNEGWVNAYQVDANPESNRPLALEKRIQGHWANTNEGYNLELRLPLALVSSKIAFAISDVDDPITRDVKYVVGTANTTESDLGTVLVPSPEIEGIISGLQYAHSRAWVIDRHRRVLAKSGDIQESKGIEEVVENKQTRGLWLWLERHVLLPLYYKILTRPPQEFIDELENAFELEGHNIDMALTGEPESQWRLSPDKKAVILSAAHPIWIDNKVMGAVVIEQTTHGIRSLRNKALEKLFNIILGVVVFGTLALLLFASRISSRIRRLRNDTEAAIDSNGKIVGSIAPSKVKDEIGDLSRTFHSVLSKLGQYNAYLENMSSRLSHELRTPIAIVNSSLENLQMEPHSAESAPYIKRAKAGIQRLSKILSNMTEATRLEQSLQSTDREAFVINEVVAGCIEGYKLAYPTRDFRLTMISTECTGYGSPELFAQMLDKVISNAVEFSYDQASIQVSLERVANKTVLAVINQGESLPENMQEELLGSMVSVRKTNDGEQPHLGLGLYITKLIAMYHGGNVTIENVKDETGVIVKITI